MSNESNQRLEEKVAYLERHVTEQDKAMLEFAEDIAKLKRELAALRMRGAGAASDELGNDPGDERPPHY